MVGEYTPTTSYYFLVLPITPSVSCSWLDALNTPSSELPLSPAVSRCLPLSPAFCNPSKFTPQPPSPTLSRELQQEFADLMRHSLSAGTPLAARNHVVRAVCPQVSGWGVYRCDFLPLPTTSYYFLLLPVSPARV